MQGATSTSCKAWTIEEDARSIDNSCGIALIVSEHTATGCFFVKLKK
jgi:hypothetical protein